MRTIMASNDTSVKMQLAKQERLEVYSYFPIDQPSCPCQIVIERLKDRWGQMPQLDVHSEVHQNRVFVCPHDKTGYNRYQVICNECSEVAGYCWAKDATLQDYFDFHYYQYTDGQVWHGCLTPNISPIDLKLGIECCCGNDTRDFRANLTLPRRQAMIKESQNSEGRAFGKPGSKFRAVEMKGKNKNWMPK